MKTTIINEQLEGLSNTLIENNITSQEELNELENVYRSLSHEEIIERINRNLLHQRVSMIEWKTAQIGFQLDLDRMNRTLDKLIAKNNNTYHTEIP